MTEAGNAGGGADGKRDPWVHKYAPKHTREIAGHGDVIAQLKHYVEHYKPGQKPILLFGKPGIGKTSMIHALAHELDLELLEINASDSRNKDSIDLIVGGAAQQQSLFFRQKLILVDEVDGVSGMQDRGGVAALVAIIPKSRYPLIFTANDADSDKLKPLMKACAAIELQEIGHEQIIARLKHIAEKEGVAIEHEQLSAISRRSGSDMRSAINDFQSIAQGGKVTKEDVATLEQREAKAEVQDALLRIFKTTSAEVALPAFDNVDEDVDSLLLWIDENLPREYKNPDDLARAFDALAQADKFFGRIRRWQYYRYYVYIYNLLSAGIAVSKEKKYPGVAEYKPTGRILKMWIYNQKNAKRKKIAEALAPQLHASSKRIRQDVLPYLKHACQKDKRLLKSVCAQYGIDDETAEWFSKS
jgi:replication factor C large subunit